MLANLKKITNTNFSDLEAMARIFQRQVSFYADAKEAGDFEKGKKAIEEMDSIISWYKQDLHLTEWELKK